MEKKNFFEKFENGELDPHIEGFASGGKSNAEYYFRAGWMARELDIKDNYIVVRKEDLTLNWYKETKARLQEEEK